MVKKSPSGKKKSPSGKKPSGKKKSPSGKKKSPSGKKPSGKKPSGKKPSGKKPSGKKPSGKKPSGKKPSGKKKSPQVEKKSIIAKKQEDSVLNELKKIDPLVLRDREEEKKSLVCNIVTPYGDTTVLPKEFDPMWTYQNLMTHEKRFAYYDDTENERLLREKYNQYRNICYN